MKPKPRKLSSAMLAKRKKTDVSESRLNAIKKMAKPRKKRVIVHLGNVGSGKTKVGTIKINHFPAQKTFAYAKKFPNFKFIGIDALHLGLYMQIKPKNMNQIKAGFKGGLGKLKDNSVDLISSEMALGYYGSKFKGVNKSQKGNYREYTKKVTERAYKKLKSGGKLLIALDSDIIASVFDSLVSVGFKPENIKAKLMTKKESQRTYWLENYKKEHQGIIFYQLSAVK